MSAGISPPVRAYASLPAYRDLGSAHRVSKNPRRPSAKKAAASARQVLGIVAFILLVYSVLVVVFGVAMATLPWTVQRMVSFTVHLWSDLSRYLG